jgi:hypothetical protein
MTQKYRKYIVSSPHELFNGIPVEELVNGSICMAKSIAEVDTKYEIVSETEIKKYNDMSENMRLLSSNEATINTSPCNHS